MRGRVRMGSESAIFRFFNSGYAHDRNISIFRRRASTVTGNTLIEPKYASVRHSRDSLHRDRQKICQKKSRRRRALKPLEIKGQKIHGDVFCGTLYYARKFGLNRLRIDGDIRQKAAITAILENVVIAI